MTKITNRQELVNAIMKKKYGSDDPKNDAKNRAFLQTLTLKELNEMLEMVEFEESIGGVEEEFDVEGEVTDLDYYDEEYL